MRSFIPTVIFSLIIMSCNNFNERCTNEPVQRQGWIFELL
jgi:hypothetical protein